MRSTCLDTDTLPRARPICTRLRPTHKTMHVGEKGAGDEDESYDFINTPWHGHYDTPDS